MWMPNIAALSEPYRTFALDSILDVGRSANTRPVKTVDDLVAWLDELFDALGFGASGLRLMGLSHGAWLAANYAQRHPARVGKLVLLAPAGWVLPLSPAMLFTMMQILLVPRRFFARRTYVWSLPDLAASGPAGQKLYRLAEVLDSRGPNELYLQLMSHWKQPSELVLGATELPTALTAPGQWPDLPTLYQQMMLVDVITYLPDDILTKVDIASMAVSLEVRSPFMDHRVVEYAATLPWSYKQTFRQRKRVLLRACHDLLPPEIRGRGKMGFGVPLARWFREEWQSVLREILLASEAAQAGFFQPAAVQRLVEEHVQGNADHSYPLWALLIFELWRREFKIG